jgi:hypothetical protein
MKKDYFNLVDVAKELKCEVGDLLHYAAKGALTLSVLMAGEKATLYIWDSDPIENDYAQELTETTEMITGERFVEELIGPFPLPLRSAQELEAGRLHEINGVADRDAHELFSEWRLLEPLKDADIKVVIKAEDLRKFKTINDLTNDSPLTLEWKKQAWELGIEWMNRTEKATGKRPIVKAIATYLEGELSNRLITGARGKFLDSETIKREALKGITGRKPGDNLRNRRRIPLLK